MVEGDRRTEDPGARETEHLPESGTMVHMVVGSSGSELEALASPATPSSLALLGVAAAWDGEETQLRPNAASKDAAEETQPETQIPPNADVEEAAEEFQPVPEASAPTLVEPSAILEEEALESQPAKVAPKNARTTEDAIMGLLAWRGRPALDGNRRIVDGARRHIGVAGGCSGHCCMQGLRQGLPDW